MANMTRRLFLKLGAAIPAIAALPTVLKAAIEPKRLIYLDTENGSWSSGKENIENIPKHEGVVARLQLHQSRMSEHVERHGKWTLTYPEGNGHRVIVLGDEINVKVIGCRPRATVIYSAGGGGGGGSGNHESVTSYDHQSSQFREIMEMADRQPWGHQPFAQYGPEFEFEVTQRKWIEHYGLWTHWDHRCHYFVGSKTAKRGMFPLVAWRDQTPEVGAILKSRKVVSRKFTWWAPEVQGIYLMQNGRFGQDVYECPWLETANGLG